MALGKVSFFVGYSYSVAVLVLIARSLNGLLIQITSIPGFTHKMLREE